MSSPKKKAAPGEKLICRNARALQRYEIEERLEAGLVLAGSEVKSLRLGRGDLEGSFASFTPSHEAVLHGFYIPPYEAASVFGHEPKRTRKLLLHRSEVDKWDSRVRMRGYSIIPLRVYFKDGWVKVELGLAKGRRQGDEREKIKREVDLKEARAAIRGAKVRR